LEKPLKTNRLAIDTQSVTRDSPAPSIGTFLAKINPVSSIDLI
jgi:hypothetical protein